MTPTGNEQRSGVLLIAEPGETPPRVVVLEGAETLMGRDSSCDVVLGYPNVSRRHARLRRREDGSGYDLEDLNSTGGTRINGRRVSGATLPLRDGDCVRIGDCELQYRSAREAPTATVDRCEATILGERDTSASAESRLADVRAEEKLRAMLDIGRELVGVHDLEAVLGRVLAALFRLFPQAERGFVLMTDGDGQGEGKGEPTLRAFKDRRGGRSRTGPIQLQPDDPRPCHRPRQGDPLHRHRRRHAVRPERKRPGCDVPYHDVRAAARPPAPSGRPASARYRPGARDVPPGGPRPAGRRGRAGQRGGRQRPSPARGPPRPGRGRRRQPGQGPLPGGPQPRAAHPADPRADLDLRPARTRLARRSAADPGDGPPQHRDGGSTHRRPARSDPHRPGQSAARSPSHRCARGRATGARHLPGGDPRGRSGAGP